MGITKLGLILLAFGIPAAFLPVSPQWLMPLAYNIILLSVYFLDFFKTSSKRNLKASLPYTERMEQGRRSEIPVTLENTGKRAAAVRIRLPLPQSFSDVSEEGGKTIAQGGCETWKITATPTLRGDYHTDRIYLECRGPFGIALRRSSIKLPVTFSVFSDLEPFRKARLHARKSLLDRESAASHRMRGLGTDFIEIREYQPGDDYRKINWKASASMGKFHTNVYDVEKDLHVIAAIDTGRLMISAAGEKSRLDYAIESALALISAALNSGDKAGLVVFSHGIKKYIPPRRGKAQAGHILNASYGLRPEYYESNLAGLSSYILKKQKRRSLIVIFTHLSDGEQAKRMRHELAPLSRRHAILISSLQNPGLSELASETPSDLSALYRRAAAIYRIEGQRIAALSLRGSGIYGFSAEPSRLPIGTVNRYLEQKKRIRF